MEDDASVEGGSVDTGAVVLDGGGELLVVVDVVDVVLVVEVDVVGLSGATVVVVVATTVVVVAGAVVVGASASTANDAVAIRALAGATGRTAAAGLGAPQPTALRAITRKWYVTPGVSPLSTSVRVVGLNRVPPVAQVRPPSADRW